MGKASKKDGIFHTAICSNYGLTSDGHGVGQRRQGFSVSNHLYRDVRIFAAKPVNPAKVNKGGCLGAPFGYMIL